MSAMQRFWRLLDARQRWTFGALQALSVVMALSTLVGIAAVIPLFAVLADPEEGLRRAVLARAYETGGFTSVDAFAVALGIAFVAFSPLARGFLTGELRDVAGLPPQDIRLAMPRFQAPHFASNLRLLEGLATIAAGQGATLAQVSLAWLLAKTEYIVPIPGTTSPTHLAENFGALNVLLSKETIDRMEDLINPRTVSGARYPAAVQAEIDTEEIGIGD